MRLAWDANGWEDYHWWQENDRKILRRINLLIKDILRAAAAGEKPSLGKAEALRYSLAGYYSCRITAEHRLVYTVAGDTVIIIQCRYHY